MPITVSNSLLGPMMAFAVIAVLALLLRWIFGRDTVPRPYPLPIRRDDYGLLCAAVTTDDPESAAQVRARLVQAGIRSTVATGRDGRLRVLVFAGELDRARRVVG